MKCSKHNWDGVFTCPYCQEEKERYDNQQKLREQEVEALERVAEYSHDLVKAQSQQMQADLKKIKEDDRRKESEAELALLRAGLPQFTVEFEEKWREINKEKERIDRKRLELIKERDSIGNELSESSRIISGIRANIAWQSPITIDPETLNALNKGVDSLVKTMSITDSEKKRIKELGNPKQLKEFYDFVVSFKEITSNMEMEKRVIYRPEAMFWLFLAVVFGIPTVMGLVSSISRSQISGIVIAGIMAVIVASIVGYIISSTWIGPSQRQKKRKTSYAEVVDMIAKVVAGWTDNIAQDPSKKNPASMLETILQDITNHIDAVKATIDTQKEPDMLKYSELSSRYDDKAKELKDVVADFRSIKAQYEYMRLKIRNTGEEIIKGLRVPGRNIRVVTCPKCGGPVCSEENSCPYCNSKISNV